MQVYRRPNITQVHWCTLVVSRVPLKGVEVLIDCVFLGNHALSVPCRLHAVRLLERRRVKLSSDLAHLALLR